MNTMCWADRNLKTLGDFDAFVFGDQVWSSRAADDQARRIASGLVAMRVAPGDRVLLWLPNGPELTISWRAVLRAGGVTVVAHHDSPLRRIEQLAAQTTPTAIVASAARFGPESVAPTVRHRIQVDSEDERPGWHGFRRIVAEHGPLVEPVPRSGRDVASIVYTSGTTGGPTGIVTRHDALTDRIRSLRPAFAPRRRPVRHLAVLPMSSAFGSHALLAGLARKCTLYFLDRFDPEQILETIQRRRIQQTFLVPTMCDAILAVPDVRRYDVSSLRSVVCSGANVSPDLVNRFGRAFGVRIRVGYGMSGIGSVSRTGSSSKPGSVGRLNRGLDAKVVDRNGRKVPAGEVGELVLRLRNGIAVEHWNLDSSVTAVASPEGWFRTGDQVRFDADGELYVVGRGDDLIIQGGHNIHGQAIAEIVQQLPGVGECAVVGVPSEYLGQEAVACVALRNGDRLTAGDIIAHCREHLEARAVPASVWFVEELPRNEMGKVKGHELRTAIQSARGAVYETDLVRRLGAAPSSARRELLRKEVRGLLDDVLRDSVNSPATTDATFRDMGLDSLGAVELTHALSESVGRPLPATLTYTHPTIESVCGFLVELLGWKGVAGRDTSADRPASPLANAAELRLKDFLSPRDLNATSRSTPARDFTRGAQVVFLTGANGFLGRFLVLEILRRLPGDGGKLYCLVRSPSNSSALERLRAVYGSDPTLQNQFDRLSATGQLVVLGGDFAQPRFGLPEETYALLSGEVDCIVHNGAVVDHVLGYRELFAPNVLGTVEIIRFAVANRIKSINYVSSVAIRGVARNARFRRNGGVGAGYASSKWASETLLKDLHDQLAVPVRIYRPSQIMAHGKYPGQINAKDSLTRLLQGIITTSLAPRSFYDRGLSTGGAHYDGLPVDAVARSITALSMAGSLNRPRHIEYHVVNPHRDVSLDAIVDWVKSAGYRVEQIDDYAAWYQAFENRLNSLSRSKRRHSLLPLIHAWERPMKNSVARYDTACFDDHIAQLSELETTEGPAEIPGISEAFIHKCLADMRVLGLIGSAG